MDDWTYTSTTGPRTWRAWTAEPEHVPPALSLTWDKSASLIDIPSIYPHHDISELDWYRLNGIDVKSDVLEAHYLAGGNVLRVVAALVAADKAKYGNK